MLDKLLFGKNYPILNVKENNNKIILYIKSKVHQCECLHCHQVSNAYHSTYVRKVQGTPIHNTETGLYVSTLIVKLSWKFYLLLSTRKLKQMP